MNVNTIVVAIFGIINIVGGLIGYFKAGSTASLIAGEVAGVVLIICAYGISRGSILASVISLIVALLLGGRFFATIVKQFKILPDLVIIAFSLLTIILVGFSLFQK